MEQFEISDSGWVKIVAVLSDEKRIEVMVDYHAAWNRLLDAVRKVNADSIEEHNMAVLGVFNRLGFAGVSERWCEQAYQKIRELVLGDKKKESSSTTADDVERSVSESPALTRTLPV
jgi:hypothetical protein